MAKRFQDKEHLKWVRQQQCLIQKAGFYSCKGTVEAHHLLQPNTGFRGGVKAGDDDTISLCRYHHSLLHTKYGTDKLFLEHYGLPENYGKEQARSLFKRKQFIDLVKEDNLPF
tara:strand:+ start:464 stop:802 length:339 start_codon:yes stop_codon:yes gene_type:complete